MDLGTGDSWPRLDTEKKTLGATERNETQRDAFRTQIISRSAADFVIVDETGSNVNLTPRYARAPRGQRAHGRIPRNTPSNSTLIAAMTIDGMGAAMVLDGATDTLAFEAYVEHFLAPTLRVEQVVVIDNLAAHKGERVRKLIEDRGCELLYLPPYSPDLNLIEEAFSKVKGLLRVIGARTKEVLVEARGKALDAVGPRDARGFFTRCGYYGLKQQL